MRYRLLETPTGPFAVLETEDGTLGTRWVAGAGDPHLADAERDDGLRPDVAERLGRYFAGDDVDFADIPTPKATPGAAFFEHCWAACRAIARGETRTYGELAVLAGGTAGGARAAGQAMRRNPLPIIVPCHRVLAAGNRLGGFGGHSDPADRELAVKRWLLSTEGALDRWLIDPGLLERSPLACD